MSTRTTSTATTTKKKRQAWASSRLKRPKSRASLLRTFSLKCFQRSSTKPARTISASKRRKPEKWSMSSMLPKWLRFRPCSLTSCMRATNSNLRLAFSLTSCKVKCRANTISCLSPTKSCYNKRILTFSARAERSGKTLTDSKTVLKTRSGISWKWLICCKGSR